MSEDVKHDKINYNNTVNIKHDIVKIYNKLVRDRIPEVIGNSGKKAFVEVVSEEKYIQLLNDKLIEELNEYLESHSVEELADLVEVVYAILDYKKVSLQMKKWISDI